MGLKHFNARDNYYSAEDKHAKNNVFLNVTAQKTKIPTFNEIRDKLPIPIYGENGAYVDCYYKTWELAWKNLKNAKEEAGLISPFIDTAFNGDLFMWDSSFNVMFGKYASRYFDFQSTLNNFYSHQNVDGFISRQITEDIYGERFTRDDPISTGPNVLPWAEWEYYCSTGDIDRLSKIFDPLCAYHNWLRLNRSWQDGSYWSCGLACGMDNCPRQDTQYSIRGSHGFMSWIDACAQQYLSANVLVKISKILGREDEAEIYREELKLLESIVNETMWDEKTAFYYDRRRDGSLSGVKSVASYWTMIAELVPKSRVEKFVEHLENEREFKRPNRIPTLSADHPDYREDGAYWRGGVWAPTNYMVLCGLHKYGYDKLAFDVAKTYVSNIVEVYKQSGTVYENYAPESVSKGNPAKADFVGWTGLAPISIAFEYLFGIHPDAQNQTIVWNVNLTERHGIKQYPLGDATVELVCNARESEGEQPIIKIKSDKPITLIVNCNGKSTVYEKVKEIV